MNATIEQLNSDDPEVRKQGIEAAVEQPDDAVVERLIELAQDASSIDDGRQAAATALGRINTERSVEFLFELLESDDPAMRQLGAVGLSGLKTRRSMLALMDALTDKVNKVRNLAERGLFSMPDLMREEGVERLLELLEHKVPLTRSPACRLIGQTQDRRALEPLLKILRNDRQWLPRMWAAKGLGDLGFPEAFDALAEAALHDQKNRVRAAATEAIGKLRHDGAEDVLRKATEDEDGGVREKAEEALAALTQAGFEDETDPFAED